MQGRYVCLYPSLFIVRNWQSNLPAPRFRGLSSTQLRVISLIFSSGMGRVKLKIKRLENSNGRQSTYAKRKHGIIKKANELSILCDIDIVLLMFSPSGKPMLCNGKNSSIEGVIEKFAQLTPQERAKRKLESLEALKKTFKKLDHHVNIQDFIGSSYQSVEDLTHKTKLMRTQLLELQNRLR
ncbi:hypothetical protein F0562_033789 [Nyssa sinensis]|uniref:MADS-box domain-containing protein n=1 Tax=Nyssa sinensis TaxID=561372 RepID=A0A5J5AHR2_9ASTE|nr:hypothetical protein F0562_033789 [Nyssa sinensis]